MGQQVPPQDRVLESQQPPLRPQIQPQHLAPVAATLRRFPHPLVPAACQPPAHQTLRDPPPERVEPPILQHSHPLVRRLLARPVPAARRRRRHLHHEGRRHPAFVPGPVRPALPLLYALHHEHVRSHHRARVPLPVIHGHAAGHVHVRPGLEMPLQLVAHGHDRTGMRVGLHQDPAVGVGVLLQLHLGRAGSTPHSRAGNGHRLRVAGGLRAARAGSGDCTSCRDRRERFRLGPARKGQRQAVWTRSSASLRETQSGRTQTDDGSALLRPKPRRKP